MARELSEQSNLIASAKRAGGYGKKLSHRFAIGMPDLLLAVPPYAPVLCEVKDLGIVTDKFDRQIDITPKQAEELRRVSEPYETFQTPYTPHRVTVLIMVHIVHRKQHRMVVLNRVEDRLTFRYEDNPNCWIPREKGGQYDILKLLEAGNTCKAKLL